MAGKEKEGIDDENGPNNASGVVLAIGNFFSFFLSCFLNTNYYI